MTTTTNGWAWVLRADRHESLKRTKSEFDGAYLAACPSCGQDTWWNAFDGESMCTCGSV